MSRRRSAWIAAGAAVLVAAGVGALVLWAAGARPIRFDHVEYDPASGRWFAVTGDDRQDVTGCVTVLLDLDGVPYRISVGRSRSIPSRVLDRLFPESGVELQAQLWAEGPERYDFFPRGEIERRQAEWMSACGRRLDERLREQARNEEAAIREGARKLEETGRYSLGREPDRPIHLR